jgi:hypothetical protein
MTNLAQMQRGLLSLLKGRAVDAFADAYLHGVSRSSELALAREIAVWWRAFGLETYCVLTSRLLHRMGIFDQLVEAFFCECRTSPFIEQLSQEFLDWLSGHQNPLVASMARFERALIRAKRGNPGVCELEWNRNPEWLFRAILEGTELPPVEGDRVYRTTVSANLPYLVSCELVETLV